MGTKLRVTNQSNGKSVIVRINDRGPFVKRRILDVSRAAAEKISMVRAGKALVSLELLR
jgi:rare lipoprotein A